jgi:hypothetical protein
MGTYLGLVVLVLAISAVAIGVRNVLFGVNVRLYVVDVSGAQTVSVRSTLVQFRTPLRGSLTFDLSASVGGWESHAVVRNSVGRLNVSAWAFDPNRPAEILASTDLTQGFAAAISGDNGVFTFPTGLALDADDSLYVADKGYAALSAVNTSKVLVFKRGVAPAATIIPGGEFFKVVTGVAVDSQRKCYVVSGSDPDTDRRGFPQVAVYAPDTTGVYNLEALLGPQSDHQDQSWLTDPRQVALDDAGYIYVTDGGPPPQIVVFPAPLQARAKPYGEVNCAAFRSPYGISICSNVIYVADAGAKSVFVFSPAAIVPFGSGQMATPIQTITRGDVQFAGPYGVDAVRLPWLQRLPLPIRPFAAAYDPRRLSIGG